MTAATSAFRQTGTAVRDAVADVRRSWSWQTTLGLVAVAAAATVPWLPLDLALDRLASTLYLALAAVALGFAVGVGGIPSLGQGAFMAIGAFLSAGLIARQGWPAEAAVAAGTIGAALGGAVTGLGVARLRGVLVAVSTWLLTWLVVFALAAFPVLSGGSQGVVVPQTSLAGVRLTTTVHYELALGLVAVAVAAYAILARGRPGLALAAAHQHTDAAVAVGVPVFRLRLGAFVASAAVAGLAGALTVQLAGVADPTGYGPTLSFKLFAAVVLGGATAAAGGLVGVLGLGLLAQATTLGGLEGSQAGRVQAFLAAIAVLAFLGYSDAGLLPSLRRHLTARAKPGRRDTGPRAAIPARRGTTLAGAGLVKRFGSLMAVDGVSVEVEPGQIRALIGPNGSGKTTVLQLLAGTLQPDAGRIVLDGRDITAEPAAARARLGVVRTLQGTSVFPQLTALENAAVGAGLHRAYGGPWRTLLSTPKSRSEDRATHARASRTLSVVGLSGSADAHADELTAFDRRLLMIATALAAEPRSVLLDEPAAGAALEDLDELTKLLLAMRSAGTAVILVEHNLRLVRAVADQVTVLDAGKTIASGTPAEIARSPAVRRAYLG